MGFKWIVIGLVAFLSCASVAGADSVVSNCQQTPGKVSSVPEFEVANRSNDLIRRPGSPHIAEGRIIYISGKVLDANCVPLQGARVMIHHANSKGVYQLDSGKKDGKNWDPNFLGLGSSITNNVGDYSFITVYPGSNQGEKPHIHFVIEHKDALPFQTVMNFSVPSGNENFLSFAKGLKPVLRQLLVGEAIDKDHYQFDITLGGTSQHLHY